MKVLKDILYKVSLTSTIGDMERRVSGVVFDSRKVEARSVFVAIAGTQVDGHDFIATALEKIIGNISQHDTKNNVELEHAGEPAATSSGCTKMCRC